MDRLYVSYEKYRRMIAEKKILHRLVQGVRILTVVGRDLPGAYDAAVHL